MRVRYREDIKAAAKRVLSKSVVKKQLASPHNLGELTEKLGHSADLQMRNADDGAPLIRGVSPLRRNPQAPTGTSHFLTNVHEDFHTIEQEPSAQCL